MSRSVTIEDRVAQHYALPNLETTILDALAAAGKDVDRLTSSDLALVDEFHTGGRQATADFAAQLDFAPDMQILDVGCGIGGASRLFAEVRRVPRRGGAFGIYDVVLTGQGELALPLPCALTAATCFIVNTVAYRRGLEAAGFEIRKERNRLDVARKLLRREIAAAAAGPSALGVHILLQQEAPRILANVVSLFDQGVLAPVELICRAR